MTKLYLRSITLFAVLLVWTISRADIPANYYNSINGKAEGDLKTALSSLIYNHQTVSSYSALPEYFMKTDVWPGTEYWWDMYSDLQTNIYIQFGKYMNREHAFPKSWWGGSQSTPAYIDLYHLYPAEAAANQAKSNYPLGTVQTPKFDNGVVKIGYAVTGQGGGASQVFEPADIYKGDFARTYFYMVTCYQNLKWDSKYMWMLQQNDYPTLKDWAITLLLQWAKDDPVSDKEIQRNETVYHIQNNRNPFIDYPELADYIWGTKKGQKFYVGSSQPTGDPELVTPVQGSSLDFSEIAVGGSVVRTLPFIGSNLRGNISLAITGADKAMFSIDTRQIAASLINNSPSGYSLPIRYTPTKVGIHSAKLIVSDGGLTGSLGIELLGQCFDKPDLSAPVALPPTNITETGYTANWQLPSNPDEVVDYYIVERTRYNNGTSSSQDLIAEENYLDIDDFDSSQSESYNVRSVRLGFESPRSNEIFVSYTGISGVESDSPLGWAAWPGAVRIVCGETQTSLTVYDIAGRVVTVIPSVENNDIIQLAVGIYFITSDQCQTPLKVIVK